MRMYVPDTANFGQGVSCPWTGTILLAASTDSTHSNNEYRLVLHKSRDPYPEGAWLEFYH
jgi:hypothetical protein